MQLRKSKNLLRRRAAEDERGFVLPIVIFGLMLMGTMTVAALLTAGDEGRSGRAMREATGAFYAAEAGLNWVYANWDTVKADVDTLSGGNHVDFGWRALGNGDSYRAVIHRWDEGAQPIYQLVVEARSGGVLGSQKRLSYMLTSEPGGPGIGYKLGECCEAPAVIKGTFRQYGSGGGKVFHSGYDAVPPGWEGDGVCADTLIDRPGVIMQDTSGVRLDPADATLLGVPPIVEDTTISDSVFDYFGEYSWQDIKDRANIIIDTTGWVYMADGSNPHRVDSSVPGVGIEGDEVYPRYTVDPMTGELLCDTNHPLNWGSDDPNDPCFNHFPIILSRGEVDFRGGPAYGGDRFYSQGIFILDFDTVSMTGSEFEIEHDAYMNGIVLGKGCVAVQYGAHFHGSIYVDATYDGVTCDQSSDLYEDCRADSASTSHPCERTTRIQWSQCAVDRAMYNSDLFDMAEPEIPAPGGVQFLGSRSFGEGFR